MIKINQANEAISDINLFLTIGLKILVGSAGFLHSSEERLEVEVMVMMGSGT